MPDFGRMAIRYVPNEWLVELRSLKYYLTSYRNVGTLQEHAVNRIVGDLAKLLSPPHRIEVEAWFNERGGLKTQVKATRA